MDEEQTLTYPEVLAQIQEKLNYYPGVGAPKESYPRTAELIFSPEQVIEVDLNSRTITPPNFLSVRYDHNAEVIYFKCDRFYENVDLANTVCVIEYLNAEHLDGKKRKRDAGLYWVPYFDIFHDEMVTAENGENVLNNYIYIPWAINGLVTKYEGTVTFAIRFYLLNSNKKEYYFNLSTKPCDAKVLHGIDVLDGFDYDCIQQDELAELFKDYSENQLNPQNTMLAEILQAVALGVQHASIYWEDVK